ncbi:phage/plasmid primase, P4 family [Nitrosomonas sp. Nm166]|uniref:phage/plasmid primase, P4 family n=1 Tax=Nitrosomonas sp. Nm166 TaxID=1881054 RepID=UPI0008EBEA81|nr:phage/plasmid primase, P4 family [Nitrosomonas sp. Nm166]SFF19639.1 putative DNA primase/helicase [Nitrosomonas sp. Nm166]
MPTTKENALLSGQGAFGTTTSSNYTTNNLDRLLNQLHKVKQTGRDQYIAICPSHADKHPSLAIRQPDDSKILIKCFAGCSAHEIVSAVGLSLSDLFPKESTYSSPIKNPFPAASVLRCIQTEALIVVTAACNIANGVTLSNEDLQRLVLAASRIGGHMNNFRDQSAEIGAEFLDKKYFSNIKKSSTNSTSNTGKDFSETNTALIQHLSSTKPKIGNDSLIVVIEGEKGGTRKSLLIESKAAEILQESLTGFLAHDTKSQTWHEFIGTHWEPLETAQQADKILVDLLYKGAGSIGFKTAYKNGIKSLLVDGDMLSLPKTTSGKLPFINGLLDLKTKRLESITPENAQTWCLPYEYKAGADCPNIKAWLLIAVDNDSETVEFIRAIMAAVLHGRNDLQKFLHLKGRGGTGKGVLMRLLTALIGEKNTVETKLDQLEQNRFEAAMLYNKRLALITESDKYGGSINNLKAITGQDRIRLERKHQQQLGSFVFQGWVVMASNESLQVTDHTSGLDRRRITVIFDRSATNEEKQAWERQGGEEAVLHSELPGLVNWLLELSQEEISKIIRNPPERIRGADLEAMTATNPIADWLLECTEADPNAWTQIGDKREIREPGYETTYQNTDSWLYANYLQWCLRSHKTALAIRRFRELLIQTCETLNRSVYESRRSSGRGISGIRIKS